jgi:cellulose synthase/poly-beta-1,6-N-acetylglucosamine synthase-like glycosyltransferase
MIVVKIVLAVATAYALTWSSYVLLLPVMARLRGADNTDVPKPGREGEARISVIVPAHNMAEYVSKCVASLLDSDYAKDKLQVYVIADHCTDNTIEIARSAGAMVLVRDTGPRGKTYTLAWAFDAIPEREVVTDLYVIVDATARVDAGFLRALGQRWMAGEDIIIGRAVLDLQNQRWFAKCLGLTLAHRNLQNLARERLGLSAFISGRGMGYSRQYIQKYGWGLALPSSANFGAHPTEDWRHGVRIVEEGLRAAFAEDARVITPLRESLGAATEQGIRWERGRIANASTHGFRLLTKGLRERDKLKIIAALDSIQPPVAILAGVCIVVAIIAVTMPASTLTVVVGLLPLALVSVYALAVVVQGTRDGIRPSTILWAPVYVAWRCMAFILALGLFDRIRSIGRRGKA